MYSIHRAHAARPSRRRLAPSLAAVAIAVAVGLVLWAYSGPVDAATELPGVEFDVIDVSTDKAEGTLSADNPVLYLDEFSSGKLAFVLVSAPTDAKSILFELDGPVERVRKDNVAPHSIFGKKRKTKFRGKRMEVGSYTVAVEAFTRKKGNGDSIGRTVIEFDILATRPTEPPVGPPTTMLPDGVHPDIVKVIEVSGEDPGAGWMDSYSVGDKCYCATTFDHNIGGILVDTPVGKKSVREVCDQVGDGPGPAGRPVYNDVQCGNGPPNDAGDEDSCPGRVDIGREGCGHIGPTWDLSVFD
ncbi:MAG: hypothetical protein AAGD35_07850 [Actinomycetota bacterium]